MASPLLPSTEVIESTQSVWGADLQPAGCQVCGQAHLVDAARLGAACPSCGRGQLEPQPTCLRPEPPELALPFRLKPADLVPMLERFMKPVWLRPQDFTVTNLLQRATPVYLPMWLVDGEVTGDWQAETGFDYQVQSSQESFNDGGWRTRPVVETRVRWEPRLGTVARHYDNLAVPALSDHTRLMQRAGQFRMEAAVRFEPGLLHSPGQAAVRVPEQPPESAWPQAKDAFDRSASVDCLRAAGAQHVRRFAIHAQYQGLHWTQLLLPVYHTFYADDAGAVHMITINGQSGMVAGPRLASQRKGWQLAGISAVLAALLFLLGLACLVLAALLPPAAVLGILMLIVAFAVGVFAIIPAAWPWQWNSRQTSKQ